MQSDLSFDCIKHINQEVLSFEKMAISQKSQFRNNHNVRKNAISEKSRFHKNFNFTENTIPQ